MDNLWFNSIGCIGLCFILKYSSIIQPVRVHLFEYSFFERLFKCSMCLGFWCGICLGVLHQVGIVNTITFGLYSSYICYIADWVMDTIESYLK